MDPEMEFRQHLADQQQRVATNDSTAANNYDEFQPNSSPNWITSLEEELDKKILVILRDGKNLIGVLRSFDQFGNLMLEGCVHRIIVNTFYNDVYQGVMIIRGENILLFGALDESKPNPLESRPLWEVLEMHEEQEKHESRRRRNLRRLGDFLYGYDLPDE
ncbi:U6 snRNA-associated Sm-like protein LSm1, putative [Eimeria tenella]|uniref:U6 snRNA-associated Sm-like protein LSm1 n=1 Tax=Eimeria tenella TaxID=5802 RepID=U6KS14_EIMTE|nr:U6 snRNA-associated Sm-like protein LSm1, putative [Eimeria tenella]CDJ40761.1 U6 snRNA-associated Sm-like protein LSm1, putative [Eimeria tenella]|eukprot:XP_013231511.1 U6 snRNA-associated Sm-like protein LSm1, putative [Eimeria tenella]